MCYRASCRCSSSFLLSLCTSFQGRRLTSDKNHSSPNSLKDHYPTFRLSSSIVDQRCTFDRAYSGNLSCRAVLFLLVSDLARLPFLSIFNSHSVRLYSSAKYHLRSGQRVTFQKVCPCFWSLLFVPSGFSRASYYAHFWSVYFITVSLLRPSFCYLVNFPKITTMIDSCSVTEAKSEAGVCHLVAQIFIEQNHH